MKTTWKPNTSYYLEMPTAILDTKLNLSDLTAFGYPELIGDIPQIVRGNYGITDSITLGMLLMTVKELGNGNVAFNIQIRPYSNFIKNSSCVMNFITESDFDIAKIMYRTDEFLSKEEYLLLEGENE